MTRFRHAPIARLEALAPFSRDHYVGLVQARHLVKAAGADDVARRKALSEFLDAWDSDIAAHFHDEERLLADLAAPEDRQRLLAEHQRLMGLADKARRLHREIDPGPATLREIGQALEAHIRWEERHLFQRLQDRLSPEQLASLGIQTAAIEQARPRNIDRKHHCEGDRR
ncbi:MAG: hemerythrin domain-containing protein [Phycisphaerales bacterium JB039]